MADRITFECLAQGVPKQTLTAEKLAEWLSEEIIFWRGTGALNVEIIIGRQNYGRQSVSQSYRNELETIQRQLLAGDSEPFKAFLNKAEDLHVILAHGQIAANIKSLVEEGRTNSALWLALVFSDGVMVLSDDLHREIAGLQAAIRFNPRVLTTSDTISAAEALQRAKETEIQVETMTAELHAVFEAKRSELDDLIEKSRQDLLALHNQYETYLVLQGPSRHWRSVASRATKIAIAAFIVFAALLAVPALTIWRHWDSVVAFLDHVIEESRGTFSIASLVVFTIPFFAYAWVLKHVSRVFNQNLLIGADAEHRRVMAVTFLGLARRKSVGIGEEDRTLVLNALFRPSPLTPQDDGPPAGLIELMSKKS